MSKWWRSRVTISFAAMAVALAGGAVSGVPGARATPVSPIGVSAVAAATSAAATNPIVIENRNPGSSLWRLPWSGYTLANDTQAQVKGYASATSYNLADRVDIKISVASAGPVGWRLFRLGSYNGAGGRYMAGGQVSAITQARCPQDLNTGRITCAWSTTLPLKLDSEWPSGLYVVTLTRGTVQNYVIFTVRDDARAAGVAVAQSTNTYQAYNNYPNNGSGRSLYAYNSKGAPTAGGSTAAVKVSFNRPYANHGAGDLFTYEAYAARYLESRGFDVKYTTDDDIDAHPEHLDNVGTMVSPGHDEYWTSAMFTAAETTRDRGGALSFWGGNNVYWQARMENSRRTLVVWRDRNLDPEPDPALKSIRFRETGRNEQPLLGELWPTGNGTGLVQGTSPWLVPDSSHWLYRGTGVTSGAGLANLVGGEADRRLASAPAPEGTNWRAVASSPFTATNGAAGRHEATTYRAPSGAWVFDAGTLNYSRALDNGSAFVDARVQAMTTNLLERQRGAALTATSSRLGGATRYETASVLSQAGFPAGGAAPVYIATGENFPDALSAAAATKGAGPVLLVQRGTVPRAVSAELQRLAPSQVFVVGSAAVVSDGVLGQIASITGRAPVRLGGSDRFATGAAIARSAFAPGVPVAYVATGLDFPDALAAGAAGAQVGGPVLLTWQATLPASTIRALTALRPQRIVVVGGPSVVSDGVLSTLSKYSAKVVRESGTDRYATSLAVMRDARAAGAGGVVALTTGADFPDALSAGPVVAESGGSLVLVPPGTRLPVAAAEEIVRTDPSTVIAVGSAAVLSDAALAQAGALFDSINGVAKSLAPRVTSKSAQAPTATEPQTPLTTTPDEFQPSTDLPWQP